MRPPSTRVAAGHLALAGTAISGALLLGELAVAVFRPQPVLRRLLADTPAMFTTGTALPYVLRPGFSGRFRRPEFDTWITISDGGFRGRHGHRYGVPTVMVLGDSFTFGHGVNDAEAYPVLLSQAVEGAAFINGGFVAGGSPDTYYAWLSNNSQPLSAYLIGFFLGNDVDGHRHFVWDAVDGRGLPMKLSDTESHVVGGHLQPKSTPIGYRYPILRESHLFHLAGTGFRQLETMSRGPRQPSPSIFDSVFSEEVARDIETTKRVFSGIRALCELRGTPVGVVMIPTLQQVRGEKSDAPNRLFAAHLQSLEVPFVDLLPAMRGRPELYYPVDQHWTPLGHRVAAQAIVRWLTDTRFLPSAGIAAEEGSSAAERALRH